MKPSLLAFLLGALGFFGACRSHALPKVGDPLPNARAEDPDGRAVEMAALRGHPVLLLYEEASAAHENQPLKDDLARLGGGGRFREAMHLVAVADVSRYDYWPVKGFAKRKVRSLIRQMGITIYCDFTGDFRRALDLRRGRSNVVLADGLGTVILASEGPLDGGARQSLLLALGRMLGVEGAQEGFSRTRP